MSLRSKLSALPSLAMAAGIGIGALGGCEKTPTAPQAAEPRSSAPATPTTAPFVAIATTLATTVPASRPATQPAYSYLVINDKLEEFPEARVRLLRSDDQVTVVLYTADPENAIDNDYQGNSFYLTMPLSDVKDSPGALTGDWRFKSGGSDRKDTTEGIFLKGLRTHLQASDVSVRVEQTGAAYQIRIVGEFLAFDAANLGQPGLLTNVSGEISATVDAKK